jgi:hypothetical protein
MDGQKRYKMSIYKQGTKGLKTEDNPYYRWNDRHSE